ncbi:E3 ubiquitin-protein ligase TRIM8-like [Gouania willdenowi]|uniref:E3 ubiquitin-protein ligase TRIM8 n=1 Tax=Gouania willdenowi TaxID=441366 RepID=A0A8C5GSG4_GOUWI|nr:E3 ubiquitin-protein ligase TRIM8-like [Gouania willdenowi]
MEAIWKSCFEEELLCPICLNVFEEPIQLPCKHSYCTTCISEAWAKDKATVRCPECNHEYEQKPTLEKNFKLANIVKCFNALSAEKAPLVLHCVLCRRGPPLPVRKVCLRCKEPCCQTHIQTHLQQPCVAPGHLLVDPEELRAWTCPSHEAYRLLHCEEEQVAVCPFCCISHCTNQRHTVCDVDTRHIELQAKLRRQEDKLECRNQTIDEQLYKLESDKMLIQDAMAELKRQVRAQYRRMHAMLVESQAKTIQGLESTFSSYFRKNLQQVQQLNEKHREAEHLLSSVQHFQKRAESLNCMKNTNPYQLLMNRCNLCLSCAIPPLRVGRVNSAFLLSSLSTKERSMKKLLEEPLREASILDIVQSPSSSAAPLLSMSSGQLKRKYSMDLLESSLEKTNPKDSPSLLNSSKNPHLCNQNPHPSSMYSTEVLSQNPHPSPEHSRVMAPGSSTTHPSGNTYRPLHFPSRVGAPPQAPFEGRKVLVCTLNNCCCSRAPATHSGPHYRPTDSFPSITSQDFLPHAQIPANQPLQHFPIRGLLEAPPATPRHPELYGLYGQPSTKHYGTK